MAYKHVTFTSDTSGMRLTIGLRNEAKRKRSKGYKILDLLVLHPVGRYHGLIIEVKVQRSDVYKIDGTLKKDEHLEEQQKAINRMMELGYYACFGIGFNGCKSVVDDYLKEKL